MIILALFYHSIQIMQINFYLTFVSTVFYKLYLLKVYHNVFYILKETGL